MRCGVLSEQRGASPDAIHAMDGYLDKVICR
jgi:hypothetical protein